MIGFVRADRVFVTQRETDVVQSFQQAVALKFTYHEQNREAARIFDRLSFEIDRELITFLMLSARHDFSNLLGGQHQEGYELTVDLERP